MVRRGRTEKNAAQKLVQPIGKFVTKTWCMEKTDSLHLQHAVSPVPSRLNTTLSIPKSDLIEDAYSSHTCFLPFTLHLRLCPLTNPAL